MRILFLSRWFPYPSNNGSKLRIYNLLRGLAAHHSVTLVTFADELNRQPDVSTMRGICEETHLVAWKGYDPRSMSARKGMFSLTPRSIVDTYSPAMAVYIQTCLAGGCFDLVIASQLATASYADCFGVTPAIFEEIEMGVFYAQYAQATPPPHRLRHGLTLLKHRQYVARLLRNFQVCTVASIQERDLVIAATHGAVDVEVIPNCLNADDYRDVAASPRPNSLIFAGPFRYTANHEAMTWFLREVYPAIQAKTPDVTLTITGDHADLPLPPATNVTLTGQVPDVLPLVASATCSIAPLQTGGGTRLKILEAMALGTPVVSTSKGTEGLAVEHNVHLLIADSPQGFADAVTRILLEQGLRRRLADNALRLVSEHYDWTSVMPRFLDLVERTARIRQPN